MYLRQNDSVLLVTDSRGEFTLSNLSCPPLLSLAFRTMRPSPSSWRPASLLLSVDGHMSCMAATRGGFQGPSRLTRSLSRGIMTANASSDAVTGTDCSRTRRDVSFSCLKIECEFWSGDSDDVRNCLSDTETERHLRHLASGLLARRSVSTGLTVERHSRRSCS